MQFTKSVSRSTLTVLLVSALLASFSARAEFLGEDSLFTGVRIPTKGQPGLPKNLKSQEQSFSVALESDDVDSRDPASVSQKKTKAQHWSTATQDGFEFKIRVKQQVSAVWVMKRVNSYDFIFANNAGSRVNLSIPAEQFYALKNAATDLRAPASDLSKCRDSFIQLEMVESKSSKTVSTCLNSKSKTADALRQFGTALTAYVR